MPSSFRDILIDRGRGSGWSTKLCSLMFLTAIMRYILAKHQRLQTLKSNDRQPISK